MAPGADRRAFIARTLAATITGAGIGTAATRTTAGATRVVGGATVDVREYGAVGDGIHDDTDAFQRAIDTVRAATTGPSRGGTVVVPPGIWSVSSVEVGWCVALVGTGGSYGIGTGELPAGSVLVQRPGATGALVRAEAGGSKHVSIERLCLDGSAARASGADTIGIGGTFSNTDIRRIRVAGFARWGVSIPEGNIVTIADCAVVGNGAAADDDHGGIALGCTEPVVSTNWIANNTGTALRLVDAPIDGRIIGNTVEGYTRRAGDASWGITITFAQRLHVVANSVRGCNGGVRLHKGGSGSKLVGNHIGDNSRARAGAMPNLLIDPQDTDLSSLLVLGNDFACEGRAVSWHVQCEAPASSRSIRGLTLTANDFAAHERIQPRFGAVHWPAWTPSTSGIDASGNPGLVASSAVVTVQPGRGTRLTNTTRTTAVLVLTTTSTPIRSIDVSGVRVFESAAHTGPDPVPADRRRFVTPPIAAGADVVVWTEPDEPAPTATWLPC